jgi:protein-disulfide isomerase
MHHALYQAQDSLGKLTWQQFAARAGVTDTIAFSNCPVTNSQPASIAAGELQAKELDVSSTPTVLVNGWKFDPSSPDQIERAVAAAVQGKSPTSTR